MLQASCYKLFTYKIQYNDFSKHNQKKENLYPAQTYIFVRLSKYMVHKV